MLLEQTRGPLNERQMRSVQGIEESGRHLLALINDMLDLSKIDADRLDLQADDVLVSEVCATSMALVEELALKKGIALSLDAPDVMATVRADPRRLKQMLVNLLSNAVKFTPAGGRVSLAARVADGRVSLAVSDTGIGIAAVDLPKLFQPFVQLDSSLARQHQGTGLGLVLVRRLAELHGGSVAVASEPGVGSTFTLSLPASRQPGARHSPPDLAAPPAPRTEATGEQAALGTVLVADDSRLNRETVGDYLAGLGYNVVFAVSGEEAVAVALVELPDIILMDIQMPGVDGLSATSQLRAMDLFARTPIVALTALAMPGDRERCLAAGASEYLTKPVSLRGLVETIQRLMRA
jgi:CheY-like chemotaxis protein/anti-sigma regulatory factor (Ser/Thr protein kinase)